MPEITMPRLSDTMQEGKIARWLKQPGESVARGEVLAEIETDKATMELEAYDAGVLERILVDTGQTVPIGQPIAVIGAGATASGAAAPATTPAAAAAPGPAAAVSGEQPADPASAGEGGRVAAPEGQESERAPGGAPPAGEARAPQTAGAGTATERDAVLAAATASTGPSGGAAGTPPGGAAAPPRAAPPAVGPGGDASTIKASPMARALARERGIDLRTIQGTGPGGRIIRTDVEAARADGHGRSATAAPPASRDAGAAAEAPAAPSAPAAGEAGASAEAMGQGAAPPAAPGAVAAPAADDARATGVAAAGPGDAAAAGPGLEDAEVRPVGRIHQIMAQRTWQSVREIPQYYLTTEIDVQAALDLRRQLEAAFGEESRVTINALVLRATALALREVPDVNSTWRDGQLYVHRRVHLGMAVAIADGLIVPVIRDADQKPLRALAAETRSLATRAREGKLSLAEVQGSTFTVTNLGMFDVEEFHGIINPPEAGLLAVGTVVEKPVGWEGQVVLRPRMRVTLSADHRAYSGDVGARFLQAFKRLLEQPLRLGF